MREENRYDLSYGDGEEFVRERVSFAVVEGLLTG